MHASKGSALDLLPLKTLPRVKTRVSIAPQKANFLNNFKEKQTVII